MKKIFLHIFITLNLLCLLTAAGCDSISPLPGAFSNPNIPAQSLELGPVPHNYPTTRVEDSYSHTPFAPDYKTRRMAYLEFNAANPGNGPYSEAARMTLGHMPNENCMEHSINKIIAREDCADFGLHGLLRVVYRFGSSGMLSENFLARVKDAVLDFKYWPDEYGMVNTRNDSMCYWSENHFILFASGAYLTGQLYPDEIFTNSNRSGTTIMEVSRPRVMRWLKLRLQTGYSEWLSNVYYQEDIAALMNLIDFCDDDEIVSLATMVLDCTLADMALNHFQGTFGSTHGRTYYKDKTRGVDEDTKAVYKLVYGMNTFSVGSMGAVSLATSEKYQIPAVLYEMAADSNTILENKQRMGIKIEEAEKWGLSYDSLEDGMTFLTLEAYSHRLTINLFANMLDSYNWWENNQLKAFKENKDIINTARAINGLPALALVCDKDITRNMRPEVNIYTYRTPDYMLSSAQDYREGYGGDQQHIWQATLGDEALCFTTHPANDLLDDGGSPNYWTGSGNLPRVAQVKNVAIIMYNISSMPGLYLTNKNFYTHAWLPKKKFDKVDSGGNDCSHGETCSNCSHTIEQNGWIFVKKNNGYLALWSQNGYAWQTLDEYKDKFTDIEVVADGKQNIWICEMGRKADYGSFENFISSIGSAKITSLGLSVTYQSPSQGRLFMSLVGPVWQGFKTLDLKDYDRYNNNYSSSGFPGNVINFDCNGKSLQIDYENRARNANSFLETE
ncbi:MAG: hypothetical protein GY754_11075 [bacterium]|nr:hypothetical protein [bacterium]